MKKSICVFLSLILLLCSVFSAALAASLEEDGGKSNQKKEDGGSSSYGSSGTEEVSKSEDGYGKAETDHPKNGLRLGDATSVITGVRLANSKLNVTLRYRNDSSRADSWSNQFWLSVYQNKKFMDRDKYSAGILLARSSLADGESIEFTLTFAMPDPDLPAELVLEPFMEEDPSVSLWFDPRSGKFGTWDELNLTEDQVTKAAATPAPIVKSREDGKTDGSVGGLAAPKAETFPHRMRAYLTFKNGAGRYIESGTQELFMDGSGQYTLTVESSKAVEGVSFLSVSVINPDDAGSKADDSCMNGRSLRIDEIQVNGKPVTFGKAPTIIKLTLQAKTNEVISRRLNSILCFAEKEFENYANDGYYFWDGDTHTAPSLNLINLADFASFQSISVTFSYGYFE